MVLLAEGRNTDSCLDDCDRLRFGTIDLYQLYKWRRYLFSPNWDRHAKHQARRCYHGLPS